MVSCNATFSGFAYHLPSLQAYANHQLAKSYDYMLLATNFGSHTKNRPGFEKQFLALSNKAWENTIDLIKHITMRGGAHNFLARSHVINVTQPTAHKQVLELNELESMALALESEKQLSAEAHSLHEHYSRHHSTHPGQYDPEVAHYLDEEFIEGQAETIRKLSGYTNDLKRLMKVETGAQSTSLNMFLFDEYLVSQ